MIYLKNIIIRKGDNMLILMKNELYIYNKL